MVSAVVSQRGGDVGVAGESGTLMAVLRRVAMSWGPP
jgi:hypothetical protein